MKCLRLLVCLLLVFSGIAIGQETPFFFPPGLKPTTDLLRQREEYERIFQATWACNQGNRDGMQSTIPGSDSIAVQTDVVSTSSVTENPAKMKMVFDHYIRQDGKIRYTDLCHSQFITEDQFRVVAEGLKKQVIDAAQRDHDFYSKVYERAIEARATKLGISKAELVAQLDEKVPGYNITFRELHHLPNPMKPSDFVPRELHLGFNPPLGGILGVTWLNTGVIYYNPNAWMTDYLNTIPKVMQHEMVHGNINIEKWPLSEAFDVELMASLPEMLYAENTTDFPSHGYATDIRELAEIYFGFDWAQARKDMVKYDFAGNIQYDDEKYVYYYKQIDQIKAEMLKFFSEVTIPEFYSDPIWWSAYNDVRGDNNSVFRVTMADHYQICSLGGCKASQEWLEQHKDEILEIAKKAFDAGLGKDRSSGKFNDRSVTPAMMAEYQRLFTADERVNIEKYFTQHPDRLQNLEKMSPGEALQFMQQFKSTLKGVTVQ
jgi:hypothetical protein